MRLLFDSSDPKAIPLCPSWMMPAEQEFLLEALATDWISTVGPHIPLFEREFCDAIGKGSHGAAVSSGTAALHLALRLVGVGPGDEVFCPSFTFIATVNAAVYLGAQPVLIDSDPLNWNMSAELLEKALAKRTRQGRLPKAVIAVHIYGQPAELDKIASLCERYEVPLIEDAAEALGTQLGGRQVGLRGRLGVFSFNGNKMISTAGGGMLVSRDGSLIRHARHLSFQGRTSDYDYIHEELAYNYRLSNLLAAVGRGQLRTLPERLRRKAHIFEFYKKLFKEYSDIQMMPQVSYGQSCYWLSVIRLDPKLLAKIDRIEVVKKMAARQIQIRPVWYPMHLQPCFKDADRELNGASEGIFKTSFCLPSGFTLTESDQERVVREFVRIIGR